jgi:hypothetical protein
LRQQGVELLAQWLGQKALVDKGVPGWLGLHKPREQAGDYLVVNTRPLGSLPKIYLPQPFFLAIKRQGQLFGVG